MDNCWNLFYLFILSLTSGSIWRTLNQLRSKLQDPGRVDISTWFLHVGTKSIAFYLEIFTTRPLLEIASSRQLAAACCQGLVKQYILLTTVGEYCQQGPHLVETADLLSYWPFILCLYELKGCLCLERKKGVVFFSPLSLEARLPRMFRPLVRLRKMSLVECVWGVISWPACLERVAGHSLLCKQPSWE